MQYHVDTDIGKLWIGQDPSGKVVITREGLTVHRARTIENALAWLAKHKGGKLVART
jgi:hypothetical protein